MTRLTAADFEAYARNVDFIQAYVFPGGMLLSESRFRAIAQAQGLRWADQHNFGIDYADTLKLWREAFDAAVHKYPQNLVALVDASRAFGARFEIARAETFLDRLTEHELEFMIVIGKEGSQIPEAKALDYVAGYCLSLDMTVRGGEERSLRKSIDSYAVIGPWLVTKDEIKDPNDVPFKLFCNGQLRHNAHTNDLIYNCQKLIALASDFYTLYPGDVIFTGAPAGVGPVKPGDVMTAECAAIGPMEVKCYEYKNPGL